MEPSRNKLKALKPATLMKKDSIAGIFLVTLRRFVEHFFIEYFMQAKPDKV